MKSRTSLLIATAIAASLSFSAFAPAAFAQEAQSSQEAKGGKDVRGGKDRGDRMEQRHGNSQGRGGMLRLVCSPEGAAHVETMLSRLDGRITLTDEQKPLFEEFKTQALAAQTTFADSCVAPTRDGSGDMVAGLKNRQTNMTAMVAAMDEVLPSLEAFHTTLTDEQKAEMKPQRGKRDMKGKRGNKN